MHDGVVVTVFHSCELLVAEPHGSESFVEGGIFQGRFGGFAKFFCGVHAFAVEVGDRREFILV
jgi:hypothetical protein